MQSLLEALHDPEGCKEIKQGKLVVFVVARVTQLGENRVLVSASFSQNLLLFLMQICEMVPLPYRRIG